MPPLFSIHMTDATYLPAECEWGIKYKSMDSLHGSRFALAALRGLQLSKQRVISTNHHRGC